MALNRTYRLHRSRDIQMILRKGAVVRTPFFRLHSLAHHEKKTLVAVVVSSKIAPKAVDRNRIRRRIQEAVRLCIQKYPSDILPHSFVFLGSQRCLEADFEDIQREVKRVLLHIS